MVARLQHKLDVIRLIRVVEPEVREVAVLLEFRSPGFERHARIVQQHWIVALEAQRLYGVPQVCPEHHQLGQGQAPEQDLGLIEQPP